jgi:hypothetical protein
MIEIKQDVSPREIRIFGLLWLIFFAGIGAVAIWKPEGLIGAATMLSVAWLVSMVFNSDTDRELQLLGVLLPVLFGTTGGAVRAGVPAWNVATVVWAAGAAGALLIWAAPSFGRRIYFGWMYAALPVGWTISHLVLGVVYYLIVTPVGLLLRLAGKDPMNRKLDPAARSYWIEHKTDPDPGRAFRQF